MSRGGRLGSSAPGLPAMHWLAAMWGSMTAARSSSRVVCMSGGPGRVRLLLRYSCCSVCSRACANHTVVQEDNALQTAACCYKGKNLGHCNWSSQPASFAQNMETVACHRESKVWHLKHHIFTRPDTAASMLSERFQQAVRRICKGLQECKIAFCSSEQGGTCVEE